MKQILVMLERRLKRFKNTINVVGILVRLLAVVVSLVRTTVLAVSVVTNVIGIVVSIVIALAGLPTLASLLMDLIRHLLIQ